MQRINGITIQFVNTTVCVVYHNLGISRNKRDVGICRIVGERLFHDMVREYWLERSPFSGRGGEERVKRPTTTSFRGGCN